MKKLYYVDSNIKLKEYDILAETEFHWTIRFYPDKPQLFVIDKSNPFTYSLTKEEAWETKINQINNRILYNKELMERRINRLREVEEAQKKYLAENN